MWTEAAVDEKREVVTVIFVKQPSKWAPRVSDLILDGRGVQQTIFIVPEPFCTMRYIRGVSYLSGYKTTIMVTSSHLKKNYVSITQMLSSESGSDLKLLGIAAIKALRNIDTWEKLCVRYGS